MYDKCEVSSKQNTLVFTYTHMRAHADGRWQSSSMFCSMTRTIWKACHDNHMKKLLAYANSAISLTCEAASLTRKEMSSSEHLSENTSNRPHVNSCCVVECQQYQFRSSVPARCHVVRHLDVAVIRTRWYATSHSWLCDITSQKTITVFTQSFTCMEQARTTQKGHLHEA